MTGSRSSPSIVTKWVRYVKILLLFEATTDIVCIEFRSLGVGRMVG